MVKMDVPWALEFGAQGHIHGASALAATNSTHVNFILVTA